MSLFDKLLKQKADQFKQKQEELKQSFNEQESKNLDGYTLLYCDEVDHYHYLEVAWFTEEESNESAVDDLIHFLDSQPYMFYAVRFPGSVDFVALENYKEEEKLIKALQMPTEKILADLSFYMTSPDKFVREMARGLFNKTK